jgi:hypothetical protein
MDRKIMYHPVTRYLLIPIVATITSFVLIPQEATYDYAHISRIIVAILISVVMSLNFPIPSDAK